MRVDHDERCVARARCPVAQQASRDVLRERRLAHPGARHDQALCASPPRECAACAAHRRRTPRRRSGRPRPAARPPSEHLLRNRQPPAARAQPRHVHRISRNVPERGRLPRAHDSVADSASPRNPIIRRCPPRKPRSSSAGSNPPSLSRGPDSKRAPMGLSKRRYEATTGRKHPLHHLSALSAGTQQGVKLHLQPERPRPRREA